MPLNASVPQLHNVNGLGWWTRWEPGDMTRYEVQVIPQRRDSWGRGGSGETPLYLVIAGTSGAPVVLTGCMLGQRIDPEDLSMVDNEHSRRVVAALVSTALGASLSPWLIDWLTDSNLRPERLTALRTQVTRRMQLQEG